jgi:hypothetical protein
MRRLRNSIGYLVLLSIGLSACGGRPSSTLPDYQNTRLRVNTLAAQTSSENAKRAALEVKEIRISLQALQEELVSLRKQILQDRMGIQRG